MQLPFEMDAVFFKKVIQNMLPKNRPSTGIKLLLFEFR